MPPNRTDPYRVLLVDERRILPTRARALFANGMLTPAGNGTTPARMLEAVLETRPNVIVLDLSAGEAAYQAIEAVMAERPTPIFVLHQTGVDPFRALSMGALDMADLPATPTDVFWSDLSRKLALLAQVRVVQHVRGKRNRRRNGNEHEPVGPEVPFPLIAIAASLGGPKALAHMLSLMPQQKVAPICICQHISDGFTGGLANWLAAETGHAVHEAKDEELLEPGHIYVAPSRYHFRVDLPGKIKLDGGPPIQGFRPSCDALLDSVAHSFGKRAIGVILTGMGKDGAMGLRAIRDNGGRTIAQDEASCVVYGMPREAVQLGAAQEVQSLEKIPVTLMRWVVEC